MLEFIIAVLLVIPTDPSVLTVPIVHAAELDTSTTTVAEYVAQEARDAGVPLARALYVARVESKGFDAFATGDMDITCPRGPNKGKPVRARGLWQITECYHPEVTDAEAYSFIWSTQWALPRLKNPATCRQEWTACRAYLNR